MAAKWTIASKATGVDLGTYEGRTEEEALIAYYRAAGYGLDRVWLEPEGGLSFLDDDTGSLLAASQVTVTLRRS